MSQDSAQGDASAEVARETVMIVDDETNAKLHAAPLATRCRARQSMGRGDP
jgi:hypothetical protein